AGRCALGAGLAPALESHLRSGLDARRDLHDEGLALPLSALHLDRRLAASDGGQERDRQVRLHPPAAPRSSRPPRPPPAPPTPPAFLLRLVARRPAPAPHVAEERREVDVLEARLAVAEGEVLRARSGPGGRHALERGVAESVVSRPLLRLGQDVVGLLDFLELG